MTNKKLQPHINFSGVLTILITLVVMVFTYDTPSPTINWGVTIFFIMLYFILALTTGTFKKSIEKGIKGQVENVKKLFTKIYRGRITPFQAFWIFWYIGYRILISSNYLMIPMPFCMIITIFFVMCLSLTNKRIKTIGEVLRDVLVINPLDKIMEKTEKKEIQPQKNIEKIRKFVIKKLNN